MLTFLAILYFIISGIIFDSFGDWESTPWNVFYFSSLFLSFLIISYDTYQRVKDKIVKGYMISAIFFFFALIIRELSLTELSIEQYLESINSVVAKIIGVAYVGTVSFVISYRFLMPKIKGLAKTNIFKKINKIFGNARKT